MLVNLFRSSAQRRLHKRRSCQERCFDTLALSVESIGMPFRLTCSPRSLRTAKLNSGLSSLRQETRGFCRMMTLEELPHSTSRRSCLNSLSVRLAWERRWCADAGRPTRFKPSSPSPTDAVRDGSAKLGHPVQNVTREHGLTPLPRWTACPKTVADDRRVPEERMLHARVLMVPRRLRPPSPSERLHPPDRPIAGT